MAICRTYVGTFSQNGGKGIYSIETDTENGSMKEPFLTEAENPTYLTVNAAGTLLYCVLEVNEFEGTKGGAVACYRILPNGRLELVHMRPTEGKGPTHLSLAPEESHLFAANYGEGTAVCYPLLPDGSIGKEHTVIAHEGSGPHPRRQTKPYAHCAVLSPDGRWLCAVDLGIDAVMLHPYTKEKGAVSEGSLKVLMLTPGAGPRHMVFSKQGKTAYVVCELISQVEVFDYLGAEGMRWKQTLSTLPDDFDGFSACAAIRLSSCGRYLYVSNRGHDSVAAFAVRDDGTLKRIGITPTGGKLPRDIRPMPGGRFMLCGNQKEGGITVLKMEADGTLSSTDIAMDIPAPVCFAFALTSGGMTDPS